MCLKFRNKAQFYGHILNFVQHEIFQPVWDSYKRPIFHTLISSPIHLFKMESNSKLVLFLNLKTKFPSKVPEPHLDHANYFTPYMLFQLL